MKTVANPLHNRTGKLTLVKAQLNHLVDLVFSAPPLYLLFQLTHHSAHFCTASKPQALK